MEIEVEPEKGVPARDRLFLGWILIRSQANPDGAYQNCDFPGERVHGVHLM
jgi:glucose-6-phosphate dehydrogenase assembly protein OpcA